MKLDTATLPDDHDALKAIIIEFAEQHEKSKKHIELLEERIRLLTNEIFGRKSEKQPHEPDQTQLNLFGQAEPEPGMTGKWIRADFADIHIRLRMILP